jgi:hypothetical protein
VGSFSTPVPAGSQGLVTRPTLAAAVQAATPTRIGAAVRPPSKRPHRGIEKTLRDVRMWRSLAVRRTRHDGAVEDISQQAHAAMVAGDWSTVRLLPHPYLHWMDSTGRTIGGRGRCWSCWSTPPKPRRGHGRSNCGTVRYAAGSDDRYA